MWCSCSRPSQQLACYLILKGKINLLFSSSSRSKAKTPKSTGSAGETDNKPAAAGGAGGGGTDTTTQQGSSARGPSPTAQSGTEDGASARKTSVTVVTELDELRVVGDAALSQFKPDAVRDVRLAYCLCGIADAVH